MPLTFGHKIAVDKVMRAFSLMFFLSYFISCTNPSDSQSSGAVDSTANAVQFRPVDGCYRMVIERDTAEMKLAVNGVQVSGDLFYNPFEKDGSFGKFKGVFKDSIISAWFTFESEGMISHREVIFKVAGEKIIEGYGDIEVSNDSAWFKYPQSLKFEDDHPFEKIDCK